MSPKSPTAGAPPPQKSARAARGIIQETATRDLPSASAVRRLFLNQLIFTFGGFGARPSGGPQLWHGTVELRKAYGYTPLVFKPEIEAYKGCDYYIGAAHQLALEPRKDMEWRVMVEPRNDNLSRTPVEPLPRCGHSLTKLQTEGGVSLLVFGGHNLQAAKPPSVIGDLLLLDTLTSQWSVPETGGRPPAPRTGHGAALVGTRLYIIGGYGGNERFYRGVSVLDTVTWEWSQPEVDASAFPGGAMIGLAYHSADPVPGSPLIAVFGGVTPVVGPDGKTRGTAESGPDVRGSGELLLLDVSDPSLLVWRRPAVSGVGPSPRAWHSSCVVESLERIYIFGGSEAPSGRLNGDLFCLDLAEMAWHEVLPGGGSKPPSRREDAAMVPLGESGLLVYGGWTAKFDRTERLVTPWSGEMFAFDFDTAVWHRIPPPDAAPPPRYGLRAVSVTHGLASPAHCIALGVADTVAGQNCNFTIQCVDVAGVPRKMGGDPFETTLTRVEVEQRTSEDREPIIPSIVDNDDGTYSCKYKVATAGAYLLAIRLRGQPIADSPFRVRVHPAACHPPSCLLSGDGFAPAARAGETRRISIAPRDAFGNPTSLDLSLLQLAVIDPAGNSLAVAPLTGITSSPSPRPQTAGHLPPSWQFTVASAGEHRVIVEYRRTKLGSPESPPPEEAGNSTPTGWIMRVKPGALASVKLEGKSFTKCLAGVPGTAKFHCLDEHGNILEHEGGNAELTPTEAVNVKNPSTLLHVVVHAKANEDIELPVTLRAQPNGRWTATYMAEWARSYILKIMAGPEGSQGRPLCKPQEILVVPSRAIASKSVLAGPGLTKALPGQPATFSLKCRDEFDNPVTGGSETVVCTITSAAHLGGGPAVTVPVTVTRDPNTGAYDFEYSVSRAGAYDISVTVAGSPVSVPSRIEVPAGALDPGKCTLEGVGLRRCEAGTPATFKMKMTDAVGNPVDCVPLTAARLKAHLSMELSSHPPHAASAGGATPSPSSISLSSQATASTAAPAAAQVIPVSFQREDLGVVVFAYKVERSGTFALCVELDGVPVGKSPYLVSCGSSPANPAHCVCTGSGLASTTADTPGTFTVEVRDSYDNLVPSTDSKLQAYIYPKGSEPGSSNPSSSSSSSPPTEIRLVNNGGGTHSGSYSLTAIGAYQLAVTLNSRHINRSPFDVTVRPGKINPPRCVVVSGLEAEEIFTAGEMRVVVIKTMDSYSNPIPAGGAAVELDVKYFGLPSATALQNQAQEKEAAKRVVIGTPTSSAGGSSSSSGDRVVLEETSAEVADKGDGYYHASFIPTLAGRCTVHLAVEGIAVHPRPPQFRVVPAELSVAHCKAKGTGLEEGVSGSPCEFTVELRDMHGNVVVDIRPTITATVTGPGEGNRPPVTVSEIHDGRATITWVPGKAGEYAVDVSIMGQPLFVRPITVPVKAGTAGRGEASKSSVHGPGLEAALCGEQSVFYVVVRDRFGNPTVKVADVVNVVITGPANLTPAIAGQRGGIASSPGGLEEHRVVTYTPVVAGVYGIRVEVNGDLVSGTPTRVTVSPGPVSLSMSSCSGDGLKGARALQPSKFMVSLRDAHGNPVPSPPAGSLTCRLVFDDGSVQEVPVGEVSSNGSCWVAYSPTRSGPCKVDVRINGQPFGGGPFELNVASGGPFAGTSAAEGEGLRTAVAGARCSFDVSVRDVLGDLRVKGGDADAIAVTVRNGAVDPGISKPEIKDNRNGTYTVSYYVRRAGGAHAVDVLVAGEPVKGSPFTVQSVPGEVDPAKAVARGPGLTTAISGCPATFVLELQDAFGNRVWGEGAEKRFRCALAEDEGPKEAVRVDLRARPDGTVTGFYTPLRVGAHTLQVFCVDSSSKREVPVAGSPFRCVVVPEDSVVGIDFGACQCAAGVMTAKGYQIIAQLPSLVAFASGDVPVFGDAALDQQKRDPASCVTLAKRFIGRTFADVSASEFAALSLVPVVDRGGVAVFQVTSDGVTRMLTAETCAGLIIAELVRLAAAKLGGKVPLRNAVVGVPAHFSDAQRQAMRESVALAGLNLVRLTNEPMAAAVAFHKRHFLDPMAEGAGKADPAPRRVLIVDCGGVKTEVCVVDVAPEKIQVLSTEGTTRMGGVDMDTRVFLEVAARMIADAKVDPRATPAMTHLVRSQVVAGKHRLMAGADSARLAHLTVPEVPFEAQLQLDLFGAVNADLYKHVTVLLTRLFEGLAGGDNGHGGQLARVVKEDIHEVVLVGGTARGDPFLQKTVKDFFAAGKCPPVSKLDALAIGLAVQGGILGKLEKSFRLTTLDRTTASFGLEVEGGEMAPVIPRNSAIPCKCTETFATSVDDQTELLLNVYEGEAQLAADCNLIGKFALAGIRPAKAGLPVDVTFEVDHNGVLSILAECEGLSIQVTITKE